MKPRSTPCVLLNALAMARGAASMSAEQSISLNVVRIAAVRCASTSRSAMRRRRRLIGTRSTRSAGGPPAARSRSAAAGGARRGRRDPCRRRGGRRALGDVAEHILLREAAILAGAGDGRRIEALLRDQPSHRRAQAARGVRRRAGLRAGGARAARGSFSGGGAVGRSALARGGLWRTGAGVGAAAGGRLGGGGAGWRPSRRRRRTTSAAGAASAIRATTVPTLTVAPSRSTISRRPGRGRGDLHRRLVRLQLEQRLVRLHGVAVVLEPAGDRALAHRLPERRNADLEAHRLARAAARPPQGGLDDRRSPRSDGSCGSRWPGSPPPRARRRRGAAGRGAGARCAARRSLTRPGWRAPPAPSRTRWRVDTASAISVSSAVGNG